MHETAIRILTNTLHHRFTILTRFQERVTRWEVAEAEARELGADVRIAFAADQLSAAKDELAREQATVAELEGSIRTLQAQEQVHAVQASYGPGQRVRIMSGGFKDREGTIKLIGDDGVLLVHLKNEDGDSITQASFKPSSVRAV